MKSHFLKQVILVSTLMIISVLTILTISSCNKDEEVNNNEPVINDNYYVMYVIKGTGTYGRFSDWTVTTPEGVYSNSGYQTRGWNQTYGPVKKGFKCEVKVGDFIGGAPTIEIHVSKNGEPFVLKVNRTGGTGTYISSASYIIDF